MSQLRDLQAENASLSDGFLRKQFFMHLSHAVALVPAMAKTARTHRERRMFMVAREEATGGT